MLFDFFFFFFLCRITSSVFFFFSSRRRHTILQGDWSSDVCSSDLRTADGRRCDPFTLTDAHSRYLLRCQAVARPDEASVRPIFEAAFKEHGLPRAIRSDNGPPFASPGVGGLSRLAIWWIKLGIRPERIVAGKPQQ